jgi:hypothetical protein
VIDYQSVGKRKRNEAEEHQGAPESEAEDTAIVPAGVQRQRKKKKRKGTSPTITWHEDEAEAKAEDDDDDKDKAKDEDKAEAKAKAKAKAEAEAEVVEDSFVLLSTDTGMLPGPFIFLAYQISLILLVCPHSAWLRHRTD